MVTAGSIHVDGADFPQQHPSAALCIEAAAAAVETAPESESDLSGPDSTALDVLDPAAPQLCWALGYTEHHCSLTARVAGAVGSDDCTVSGV